MGLLYLRSAEWAGNRFISSDDAAWRLEDPDGRRWAFTANDREVQVCEARTQICTTRYTGQKSYSGPDGVGNEILYLLWSPDGRQIASGISGSLDIWDAATGQHRVTIAGPVIYHFGVAWSPDGKWLLVPS